MKPPAPAFRRLAAALSRGREGPGVNWEPRGGPYPRLQSLDADALAGQAGLYLLWHLGVRPRWLRAGATADLGAAVRMLKKMPTIMDFKAHGGPFISWSLCARDVAPGYVNFLAASLYPVLQAEALTCDLVADPAVPPTGCGLPAGTNDLAGH